MKPAARVQAATILVEEIEAAAEEAGPGAETIIRRFFSRRRYAGSKDRAAIIGLALDTVRARGEDCWRLTTAGTQATARLRVALRLADAGNGDWPGFFDGSRYGPEILTAEEGGAVAAARDLPEDKAPAAARLGVPDFLVPELAARFGEDLAAEAAALKVRAPVDVRVNTLKSDINRTIKQLEHEGLIPERLPWSMVGLRLTPGTPVSATQAFRAGRIEIQDEGSQIAALLAASGHPRQVVDLCAGAGGKTLALAAALGNHGQIYAFDRDRRRLGELAKRLKTARVRNVQWRNLLRDGDSPHLRPLKERMDLVLIDVPCSGSGTWRRHPELPWRLTPARLATLIVEQCALLERGAALVKPGGRVAYVTCSLLPAENEAVVEDFLRSHDTFSLLSYEDAWRDGLGTALPETLSRLPEALQLSPGRHGTDGFFIALLERET